MKQVSNFKNNIDKLKKSGLLSEEAYQNRLKRLEDGLIDVNQEKDELIKSKLESTNLSILSQQILVLQLP